MKPVLLAVAAALAFPGVAVAKELRSVTLCGSRGCGASHETGFLRSLSGAMAGPSTPFLDAVPIGPYYELGFEIKGDPGTGFGFVVFFVPPNFLRPSDNGKLDEPFFRLRPPTAALFRRLTAGREPFPTPRVVDVTLNGEHVASPRPYIGLFAGLPSTQAAAEPDATWMRVTLVPDRANPWFARRHELLYDPSTRTLFLIKPARVGGDLAERIADDAGIGDVGGVGWRKPAAIGLIAFWLPVATGLFIRARRWSA